VPGVWNRLWLVPGVRIENVNDLERYLMYIMGLWMVWKGVRSTVWVMVGTQCADWECGWLGKVPRVWNEIMDDLERCPVYGFG
jgi:hypothetical protein